MVCRYNGTADVDRRGLLEQMYSKDGLQIPGWDRIDGTVVNQHASCNAMYVCYVQTPVPTNKTPGSLDTVI